LLLVLLISFLVRVCSDVSEEYHAAHITSLGSVGRYCGEVVVSWLLMADSVFQVQGIPQRLDRLSKTTFDLGIGRFFDTSRLMENLGRYFGFLTERYDDLSKSHQWASVECNCLNRM
jgi:hypothetical protein